VYQPTCKDNGMTAPLPRPGWYPDQTQTMRWWDGSRWGHAAPLPAETENGRLWVMLSHLSAFIGGWILALVIRQTEGKKNRFVMHHATEALNFQITFFIPYTVCIVGFVISAGVGRPAQQIVSGIGLAVFGLLAFLLFVGHTVFAIIGCVKSSRGEWWRYPINIRFVSGASTDEH
jgi:uncharacterized Tic20 family protein